ncbi:MAG TPA: hypothetical protein VGQ60_04715 [Nitrospiraceae bacterium]|nr:hypothetical protein [Nitrospiraceae bacterium]
MARPVTSFSPSASFLTLAALLACLLCGAAVSAETPVAIEMIVKDPTPHHLRQVMLRGTVRQVHQLEPYFQPSGMVCYGAYVFTLEDETGTLDIVVLGECGSGKTARAPDVSDGNRVIVRANVQAPGRLGVFYGLDRRPIHELTPQALHAIAREIVHIAQ